MPGTAAAAGDVTLEVADVLEPLGPDPFGDPFLRQMLALEQLGVHADDEDFFVVGTVEHADPPALGQYLEAAPHEIVVQLLGRGNLEAEHLRGLWIDATHHVLDGAVLPGRVHRLEDQEE